MVNKTEDFKGLVKQRKLDAIRECYLRLPNPTKWGEFFFKNARGEKARLKFDDRTWSFHVFRGNEWVFVSRCYFVNGDCLWKLRSTLNANGHRRKE